MKKIHRCIGLIFTTAVAAVFWLSLFSIDKGWLPIILCTASCLCLYVIMHRNGWIYDPERDEAE